MGDIFKYQAAIENAVIEITVKNYSCDQQNSMNAPSRLIHQHVSAEVFACEEGELTLRTQDRKIMLHAGDIAIVPPGAPHALHSGQPGINGYVFSFICFPKTGIGFADLNGLFAPFLSGNHILIYQNQPAMLEKAKDIFEHHEKAFSFYPVFKLVELLMIALKSGTDMRNIHADAGSGYIDIQFMMQLDEIIAAYYSKSCSMEEIAAMLNISTRQINRIVKKWYNKTLRELFNEQRIHVAEHYLVTTDLSLDKIAEKVGFSSYPCLYREFFKKHNLSPAEYRKNHTSIL